MTAQWSPFPGIEVTTTITPTATGHCRHHEIDSSFDCEAYDCGFAVPNFAPGYAESVENDTAEAHCDTLRCTVRGRERQWSSAATPTPACTSLTSICRREVPHPQGAHRTGHRGL